MEGRKRSSLRTKETEKKPLGRGIRGRRPEAVLVKVPPASYADTLRKIKKEVDLKECGVEISKIMRTRGNDILVEIKKGTSGVENLKQAVSNLLGEVATVRTMGQMCDLQVRDLDEVTEEEEIVEAISSVVEGADKEAIKVRALRAAFRGTQLAVVTVPAKVAEKLLETGKVKIGWTVCRVRQKVEVLRCYKCQGFGHVAMDCKGPDRSKVCRLCGKEGHLAKNCKGDPFCIICRAADEQGRADHIPGSARCPSFQKAKEKKRKPNG